MGSSLSRAILLSICLALGMASTAAAVGVSGRLLLGAYKPAVQSGRRAFNWELENGFKQVQPDRIDAARELAVVLLGEGDPQALDRVEVPFIGGSLLPTTIVVRPGTTVVFRNEDEIAHELYADGLDKLSPEAISPRGRRSVNLEQAGSWPLRDKLVTHVRGHLHVLPDLVAVGQVDGGGRFSFANVPPGTYTLKVFHGSHELASQQVEASGGTVTVDPIALTAPAEDDTDGGDEDDEGDEDDDEGAE
ncbi:MAG: hypothetical protein PVI30_27075 [Myxococcales bacterium]|jgi:hypothetical protein